MGDELDVDAMLEAPFVKEERALPSVDNAEPPAENGHSTSEHKERKSREKEHSSKNSDRERSGRDRERERDREKDRRSSRERRRSRSRSPRDRRRRTSRDRDRDRRRRSRSRGDRRRHSRDRRSRRSRSRSRGRDRRRSRSRGRDSRRSRSRSRDGKRSKSKTPKRELTVEERDARTVFCMQLSSRIKARDLEDFFSVVGKISDVRIITDAKTRRSKGIAYVEFEDVESVPLALGLSGQKVLGVPIIVQLTQAEKNRAANNEAMLTARGDTGPMRLYVGSLHFNISEEMLRSIFEPFGKVDTVQLIYDSDSGRSKGYGFVTFHNADDAKKALEQLNGFELAGRPMKVNHVTERADGLPGPEGEEFTPIGFDMSQNKIGHQNFVFISGATGRLQLMAKLAEGTGLQLPPAAADALSRPSNPAPPQPQMTPSIATQCFLLSNMFDPSTETNPNWAKEITDDVVEECNKHGGVFHVFVDRQSAQGNVYVKCPSIATAVAAVNALHGRYFAGKMITAAYVPVLSYHSLFPDAISATKLL